MTSQQNDISAMRTQGLDLANRWQELLVEIKNKTGFIVNDQVSYRTSTWWRTGKIGAVIIEGQIRIADETKLAVLKIQGTKPNISEADQIHQFQAQNKSQIIRPPHIYAHLPWDEASQFEAIVFEKINGSKVLDSLPAKTNQLNQFFHYYQEYRQHCLNQAWLEKPKTYSYRQQLAGWREAVAEQAKDRKYKLSVDQQLLDRAISFLDKHLKIENFTFQHGHVSTKDFVTAADGQIILLSNLFWGWRLPGYDAIFAYHWHMLGMEHVENLSPTMLVAERDKWLTHIYNTSPLSSPNNEEEIKHGQLRSQIDLALLERTLAALLVDRYMLAADPDNKNLITNEPIIVDFLKSELERLVSLTA